MDDLIESEFGFRPLIARTCRLGRPIDGRIQPIAVNLSAINDAIYLVDNAEMLRKSANDNVRQFIYINRDMTKAEAQAAFDQRNQRRNERRTGVTHPPAAQSTARPASSQSMGTTDMSSTQAFHNITPASSSLLRSTTVATAEVFEHLIEVPAVGHTST